MTGGAGLVGSTLIATAPEGWDLHATQHRRPVVGAPAHRIDLADAGATQALIDELSPHLVVHTAYRNGNQEVLDRDVVLASATVAAACAAGGVGLVHCSSDVVFDGEHAPYAEDAELDPLTAYGAAKAEAERRARREIPDVAIIRTSLVVRADPPDPASAGLLDGLRAGTPMTLFTDELRMPISVEGLASAIWTIAALPRDERAGIWHLAGPEAVSRHALGLLVAARARVAATFPTASSRAHPHPRPRDLRLSTARADAAGIRPAGISEVLAPPP